MVTLLVPAPDKPKLLTRNDLNSFGVSPRGLRVSLQGGAAMRKFIFAALATAVLAPAALFAGSASAQVVPFSKFQQLLDQDNVTIAYAARRGGGRGGFHGGGMRAASVRRPAGMHAG